MLSVNQEFYLTIFISPELKVIMSYSGHLKHCLSICLYRTHFTFLNTIRTSESILIKHTTKHLSGLRFKFIQFSTTPCFKGRKLLFISCVLISTKFNTKHNMECGSQVHLNEELIIPNNSYTHISNPPPPISLSHYYKYVPW